MAITAASRTNIIELNVLAGNGAPGTTGLGALVATYNISGVAGVAASITTSASWTAKFPTFQTPEEFGKEFLEMIVPGLSAAGMAEGITIIAGLLNSGSSQADVLLASSNFLSATSVTDAAFGDYAAKFQNQTAVAIFHTVTEEKASPRALDDITSDAATIVTAKADIDGSTAAAAAAAAATAAAAAAAAAATAAAAELAAAQPALDAASADALTAYNTAAATSATDATAASDAATAATTAAAAVTSLALANSSVTAAALAASTAATSVTSAAAATAAAATLATAAAANVSTTDDAGATAATAATVAAAAAAAAAVTAAATQVSTAAPIPATYVGSTFTLTTGTDFVSGTIGDDIINAVRAGTSSTTETYSPVDQIAGGAGTDTLYVETDANLSFATVTGVEKLQISAITGNVAITLANDKAYTELQSLNSTTNVTFNSIKNGDVNGAIIATADASDTTYNYAATALTGAADNLDVMLSSADGDLIITGGTAANALETITLNSVSDGELNDLTSLTLTPLNLSLLAQAQLM